jgi:protocatechuate 3,4-dioxygenase beta subunit
MQPLIERDVYGKTPARSITPPNVKRVHFSNAAHDAITIEFDQPVKWNDALATQLYLDGENKKVASGSVAGSTLVLKLKEQSSAKTITYLKEANWSQDNLLWGENDIAALTFCEVPIGKNSADTITPSSVKR